MIRVTFLLCLGLSTVACSHEPSPDTAGKNVTGLSRSQNAVEPIDTKMANLTDSRVIEHLRKTHAYRLAGLYVEDGGRKIVVRLTGADAVPPESYQVGSGRIDVVFVPTATHTFAQLNRLMADNSRLIDAMLPTAHARYVDERTGDIVVAVVKRPQALDDVRRDLSAKLGAPVRIIVQQPLVARPAPSM